MSDIQKKIYKINPVYLMDYEDLIKKHSQFGGGAKDEKFTGGRTFSNVYEFYIYAFFIGLYSDTKKEILSDDKTKTFWEMENWKPRELIDYMLACAIGNSDFDMINIENMQEQEITQQIKTLKNTIEVYANGGLSYINELLVSEPSSLEDDMLFIKFLAKMDK